MDRLCYRRLNVLQYFSDTAFDRPIITHAKLQSNFSDVYFYEFSYHGILGNNNITVDGEFYFKPLF